MIVIEVTIKELIKFDATPETEERNSAQLEMKVFEETQNSLLQLFNAPNPNVLMEIITPYIIDYVMNRPKIHMMVGYKFGVTYEFLEGVAVALAMVTEDE